MSEVKRYDCTNGGFAFCQGCYQMKEDPLGDYVSSEDYDALVAKLAMAEDAAAKGYAARQQCGGMEMEIQELRAELAALRARVVVAPDASTVYAALDARERLFTSPENIQVALEAQSRITGKTVSEGLLRQLLDSDGIDGMFDAQKNYAAHQELRALLNQDKENGNG
ncbi:TPA: hypothetical protein L5V32_003271 [Pseudomonas aeruginosa]|uniref:hypothetical protein n=1 Tax=Pseudomonas aeruginosa TaxID=287 RepID=UPI0029DD783C|nr:hypothetical protein [Pseudomonas aeruginosa]HBP1653106.1 hypothetical protein [Pseudomonas aeruginosa]HCF3557311.1 hypothetical protein [Pseudomonas aeruginosa]HDQ4047821.1 hypothetical protein [Pseudomonas aeruginosa]HDQ4145332.1 hypothetical protein [Pseudomonas aeruginosa]